jgi:hypothetical protein
MGEVGAQGVWIATITLRNVLDSVTFAQDYLAIRISDLCVKSKL